MPLSDKLAIRNDLLNYLIILNPFQGTISFSATNIIPKYGEKIKSLSQQIFLNPFMNNNQDLQNNHKKRSVLLVVLHKKSPILSHSRNFHLDFWRL